MASEKATALVLRVVEFSETSSIVTLFTREFGKLSAIAKGARRLKGPFESALDLLALCRIVFRPKAPGILDLLTEAKLERRFRPYGRDLTGLYAAYYVAELITELTEEHDPHPELFDLADAILAGLAQGDPVAPLVLQFELGTLSALGHLPSLEQCAECGQVVQEGPRKAFGPLDGGVLCRRCRIGKRHVVSVSDGVMRTLERYANSADARSSQDAGDAANGELRAVMNHYLSHLVGHKLRMHEWTVEG